jgi:hypothetical protein
MNLPQPGDSTIILESLRESLRRSRELREKSRLLCEEATHACGAADDLLGLASARINADAFWIYADNSRVKRR